MTRSHCGSESADRESGQDVHKASRIDRRTTMHARPAHVECEDDDGVASPHSYFRFIVGGAIDTSHVIIYEDTCRWLFRVVQTKLFISLDDATGFDDATLATAPSLENYVDVGIQIAMSRASYVEHLDPSMSEVEMCDELDATIQEIKRRCTRSMQWLHERIGERVAPPVTDDIRIQVTWLDDWH